MKNGYTEPIGFMTQIEDTISGPSKEDQNATAEKIEFAKQNVNRIKSINGSRVYNVIVDDDKFRYNLRNTSQYPQKYYYPIKYANVEFGE